PEQRRPVGGPHRQERRLQSAGDDDGPPEHGAPGERHRVRAGKLPGSAHPIFHRRQYYARAVRSVSAYRAYPLRPRHMKVIQAIPHYPEAGTFQIRVSLGNLLQAIRARKWVVVATTILTTALVIGYIWIWPPTFEAEVMIAADSDKDMQRAAFYQGWNTFR